MLPHTLKFKVGFYLAIALTAAMLVFAWFVIRHQRAELLQAAVNHVTQISEVITKSTRYAMLQNQPDYVFRVIQDVGHQEGIEKVRIFSKEGRIIHSTYAPEIGQTVDRKADACILCHQGQEPLTHVNKDKRSRIYSTAEGRRLLGSMEVIRNEPSCSTAACHVHNSSQTVLGVLDIVYSLKDIDEEMRTSTVRIAGASLAFVVLASVLMSLFVHRLVYVPLKDLESGARRLSMGNLEEEIPVRSQDEFGKVAAAFNLMMSALRKSQQLLQEWGHTLEEKVAKRTQELRLAEAERARSDKLASVGLLAAGVAHEINNPLTGILTFSHLLRKKMPEGSQDAEDLDLVIRETKRCGDIIKRLLDFAREKAPEKNYCDLNKVVEETARLVERTASFQDVELKMELAPDLPPVWLDQSQIKQVAMNMLVNAQQAIDGQGRITIGTRVCANRRSVAPGEKPVPMAELWVADTGCGIPKENLTRIFDPFFTSKEVGKGTGLGLAVSHGIVKAHGGTIEVESTVGVGSVFHVFLPLADNSIKTRNENTESHA
jgi:two-component system, NtrC family, sensor kinase